MSAEFTLKAKLFLVAFGLGMGLIASEIALSILDKQKEGVEFENVDELRRAMLKTKNLPQGTKAVLRDIIVPHPDDKLIYTLKPGLDVKFQREQVKTNSCGMRDIERSIVKPDNTYRIAVLGDSFTFGWGVKQEEAFPAVLERTLNKHSTDDTQFEVLNFGVPGYSTFQEVQQFKKTGIEFDPDAVIVFFLRNDFGYPFFVRNVHKKGGILNSVKFARLTYKAMDKETEEQRLQLLGLSPNTMLTELSDFCREHGIRLLVAINPKKDWRENLGPLPIISQRDDIELMQLRRGYLHLINTRGIDEKDLTLAHDPHPSPIRHQLFGELMASHFLEASS